MKPEDLDLLLRGLDADLSAEEDARRARLLADDAPARAEERQHRAVRRAVAATADDQFGPYFADRVMRRVAAEAFAPAWPVRVQTWARSWTAFRWGISLTAVAAVLVVMAVGMGWWMQPQILAAPPGQTRTHAFADGSVVTLGSGATLRHRPFWGRSERRVVLTGEAFFDVADDARPFIVETFNAEVVVLGTRFNVRAWPEDAVPETVVALEEGHVDVAAKTGGHVVLEPGEATRVVAGGTPPQAPVAARMDRALAWRTGGLAFTDRPLGDVLRALERRFARTILSTDTAIAARPVTYFNPRPGNADAVLGDLCASLGLRYRPTADGFVVLAP